VLLADDDDEMRRLLADALRLDGHEVVEARDGTGLMSLVGSETFPTAAGRPAGVIVSDVRMPGATGLDVLREVRRRAPMTPMVLITAFGDAEFRAEAHRLGADAVLDKPIDLHHLLEVVRYLAGTE
jgi:DNA-binding response OmpR family regulator